ncbi:MAG: CPBP family intramembrane metalloprotease [Planctomycetaceae bacterium]|nr:CPBP family intramembrane metalloprotease [Planctomycetales bacterium]MCB9922928.1 CPBP family intramembrane metalloprotease [Planctomycetaceae bacterium]
MAPTQKNSDDSFVTTAFSFEAALGVGALLIGWAVSIDPLGTVPVLREATVYHYMRSLFWGSVATVPLLAGLLVIDRLPFRWLLRTRRLVSSRILPLFSPLSLFEMAAISLAAGFGEELLFRGLLQSGIAEFAGGKSGAVVAIIATSLLFGLCHWITPGYAALAMVASLYLGILFARTGNLLVPLIAHGLYDFLALVYLTRSLISEQE